MTGKESCHILERVLCTLLYQPGSWQVVTIIDCGGRAG